MCVKSFKNILIVFLLTVLMIAFSNTISAYTDTGTAFLCDSCSDCNAALNNNKRNTIYLTADIINFAGTCISNPSNFNNKIFDCQGYIIDGDYSLRSYGIYLNGKLDNTIENCIITNFWNGINLKYSSNNIIAENTVNSNRRGISLSSSPNSILTNNTLNSNNWNGIYLYSSPNSILTNNTVNSSDYGIYLYSSSNSILTNNTVNSNFHGIQLIHSSSNSILTNNTLNSNDFGIILSHSSNNNTLKNNLMSNNTFSFEVSDYYQDIDISNTVDGKPIYYWTNEKNAPDNCKNLEINELSNAGFVALISCDNITIKNLNLSKNVYGILLVNTTNSKILNNTVNSNVYGIHLISSSNNIITNNTANKNSRDGLYIHDSNSTENKINSNTFCSNNQSNRSSSRMDRVSYYDIYDADSNIGDNNTCGTTYHYDDTGTTGCTYSCPIDFMITKTTNTTNAKYKDILPFALILFLLLLAPLIYFVIQRKKALSFLF